ncbi:type II toxin-antitoxin system RelE/ParE family toxin [Desulfovibrio sp. OttesenSCG-928-M16]|nr:type II toxin-antitoxin system RelE/ParE family toxin [Desulfovibrio sp. OttesenSCG-928-M16]
MAWKVEITPAANAELKKLGTAGAQRILKFLFKRLQNRENPREIGEALKGNLRDFWRYRVGDYRILCRLNDGAITVFVVHIAHRREVYKK